MAQVQSGEPIRKYVDVVDMNKKTKSKSIRKIGKKENTIID